MERATEAARGQKAAGGVGEGQHPRKEPEVD